MSEAGPRGPSAGPVVSQSFRGALLGLFVLLLGLGALRTTGLLDAVDADAVRERVSTAGSLGPALYVLIYVFGLFAGAPGSILVGGGVLAFGPLPAGLLAYAAAMIANSLAFGLARTAAGRDGWWARGPDEKTGPVYRMAQEAARRPFVGVLIVRLLLPTAVLASFALAMTGVGVRPYLLGSALGVIPQLTATVAVFAWALSSG